MLKFLKLMLFLWSSKGPNILTISKYGLILINRFDQNIGREIISFGYWAHSEIELFKRIAQFLISRHGSIVFYDVGANIGTHSLALAVAFRGKIKIRAFEPQQAIFQLLCGTLAINNVEDVECHPVVVNSRDGDAMRVQMPDYHSANNFGGFEFLQPKNSDNQEMKKSDKLSSVSTVSLDSFNEEVHLIKIDVEGMEDEVLRGAIKTISKYRPICYVEINKTNTDFVLNYFERLDYVISIQGGYILALPNKNAAEFSKSWLGD